MIILVPIIFIQMILSATLGPIIALKNIAIIDSDKTIIDATKIIF
jgi:hypothetical protein